MTLQEIRNQLSSCISSISALIDLRTDRAVVALPLLPAIGAAGSSVVDPTYGAKITRVSDQLTKTGGRNWGTPSAANLNAWSSDGKSFYLVDDAASTVMVYTFIDGRVVMSVELFFVTEPCFARALNKPGILYAPHYGYVVAKMDAAGVRTTLLDMQTDVGPLSQNKSVEYPSGSYMSACYASAGTPTTPERIAVSYGDIQESHRFVTVFDVDDPAKRVTINLKTSSLKVNGGAWLPLLRPDGSPANTTFRLHAIAFDRTGKWVKLDISGLYGGAAHTAFFNVETQRLHEWTSNAYYGHSTLGYEQHLTCIADPAGGSMFQWLLTDLTQPGFPPAWRPLVLPYMSGSQVLGDHNSWNNAKPDSLEPVFSGTQRGNGNTGWGTWYDEILSIDTTGPTRIQRICHHRMQTQLNGVIVGTFRDSPRIQVSPDGQHVLFTSNWDLSLGTFGPAPNNQRRDGFMVEVKRAGF